MESTPITQNNQVQDPKNQMIEESKNPEKPEKSNKVQKDNDIIIESSENLEVVNSFDELNLREDLLRGVYAYGFDKPSAVQKRAILPILKNRDVIV